MRTILRIDFFFIPVNFISKVTNCFYHTRILSDHSALSFEIEFVKLLANPKPWGFNIMLLSKEDFTTSIKTHLETFSEVHQNSATCPLIKWGTLKVSVR